jgi:nitrogen-specific signal transduction histidine kinase
MQPSSSPITATQHSASAWLLPTISQILAAGTIESSLDLNSNTNIPTDQQLSPAQVEWQWHGAIAALTGLLHQFYCLPSFTKGLVFTSPAPLLSDPHLLRELNSWIFTNESAIYQLPPAAASIQSSALPAPQLVPLLPTDPLISERFCLVLTAEFSLIFTLATTTQGHLRFQFSFNPEQITKSWQALRSRILLLRPAGLHILDPQVEALAISAPNYQIVEEFSRLLMSHPALPLAREANSYATPDSNKNLEKSSSHEWRSEGSKGQRNIPSQCRTERRTEHREFEHRDRQHREQHSHDGRGHGIRNASDHSSDSKDVELLQAIAHEVRTPLTTIKTLTRLLLKRSDLPAEAVRRLEAIYRECAEQIDRFSLIFRAAELEISPPQHTPTALTSVSLVEVFREGIPRWQKQAARRNLSLQVLLPPQMPAVISDPTLLDQVLTGLIEHVTHQLPNNSQIQVEVTLAGDQLKLQLRSGETHSTPCTPSTTVNLPILKSVGHLLMVQPETGNLSLSLPVTKNLFQILGGKLTVRKHPDQGEILTIFLPLGQEHP